MNKGTLAGLVMRGMAIAGILVLATSFTSTPSIPAKIDSLDARMTSLERRVDSFEKSTLELKESVDKLIGKMDK